VIDVLEICGGFCQKFGYIRDIKTWLHYLEKMLQALKSEKGRQRSLHIL
jgi:hypothetical protein